MKTRNARIEAKECGCPLYRACECKLKAAERVFREALTRSKYALAHSDRCATVNHRPVGFQSLEPLCDCEVDIVLRSIEQAAQKIIEAARDLI